MNKIFTNYEDGARIVGRNGQRVIWENEDDRGKTSISFKEGDIWVVPTNDGFFKVKLRLKGVEAKEIRLYEMKEIDEEKMWFNIELEVDRMLTDLGY